MNEPTISTALQARVLAMIASCRGETVSDDCSRVYVDDGLRSEFKQLEFVNAIYVSQEGEGASNRFSLEMIELSLPTSYVVSGDILKAFSITLTLPTPLPSEETIKEKVAEALGLSRYGREEGLAIGTIEIEDVPANTPTAVPATRREERYHCKYGNHFPDGLKICTSRGHFTGMYADGKGFKTSGDYTYGLDRGEHIGESVHDLIVKCPDHAARMDIKPYPPEPCTCTRVRGKSPGCPACHHSWDDHGFAHCRGNDVS